MSDRVIWKWAVEFGGVDTPPRTELQLPIGTTFLAADMDRAQSETAPWELTPSGRRIELWGEVDLQQVGDDETRTFTVVGTGQPLPDEPTVHVATLRDGPFVWHLLEVLRG